MVEFILQRRHIRQLKVPLHLNRWLKGKPLSPKNATRTKRRIHNVTKLNNTTPLMTWILPTTLCQLTSKTRFIARSNSIRVFIIWRHLWSQLAISPCILMSVPARSQLWGSQVKFLVAMESPIEMQAQSKIMKARFQVAHFLRAKNC